MEGREREKEREGNRTEEAEGGHDEREGQRPLEQQQQHVLDAPASKSVGFR
jgi:hypothetical protein